MVVMDQEAFRVLRDFFEPGAMRTMHAHESAYHVMTVITGTLRIGFEGAAPIEVTQGEVLHLDGGVRHSIENIGTNTATLIEVFDKVAGG
jgi:quercetin dioxygenase-like cupin family protein